MAWTERQQQAIDYREHKDLLVAAAAGSGKTSVMVERVIRLILEGEAGIDEILAVTFTKAAASGMKEKIVDRLRARIGEDLARGDSASAARLSNQLALVAEADISTFDSFAQKVVRENFQTIDIDPGAGVCDEAKSAIMRDRALDELLEGRLAEAEPSFIAFMDAYSGVKSLEAVKESILDIYRAIMAMPGPFSKLSEMADSLNMNETAFVGSGAFEAVIEDLSLVRQRAADYADKLKNLLKTPELALMRAKYMPEWAGFENLDKAFDRLCEEAGREEPDASKTDELAKEINLIYDGLREVKEQWRAAKGMSDSEKAAFEAVKEEGKIYRDGYWKAYEEIAKKYFAQPLSDSLSELRKTHTHARVFCDLVQDFHRRFMEKKAEKHMYDFGDFMHFALEALKDDAVAEQYKNRFKYIFVDEYQDSNELQDELIRRISRGGNVFMVGDIKQSIYRFRQAEPRLFTARYGAYKKGGGGYAPGAVIDLNSNFRSKNSVVDAVNAVFEQIMEGYDEDARLHAGNTEADRDNVSPFISIVDCTVPEDGEKPEEGRSELEALNIARIIKKKMKEDPSLCFRDIVILMSSYKGVAGTFKEVFEREDIPLFVEEEDGYFDAIEVAIVLNILRVIDNMRQDIPLISVLYSSVFGFSCEELAKIRILGTKDGSESFCEAFLNCALGAVSGGGAEAAGEACALAKRCAAAYSRIREWKAECGTMPLPDFIWKIYRETGMYIFMGALPGGEQRQSNLRMLVSRAIAFSKEGSGLYSFLQEIDAGKNYSKVPPAGTIGESADAVRITTIHKSKGLEYPCVIIAGMQKEIGRRNPTSSFVKFNKSVGMAFDYVEPDGSFTKTTIMQKAIDSRDAVEDTEERIRLLYVAFTRAIKHLVVSAYLDKPDEKIRAWQGSAPLSPIKALNAKTYLDWIMPTLSSCIPLETVAAAKLAGKGTAERTETVAGRLLESAGSVSVREEIARRLSYEYPYAADVNSKSKYSVSELNFAGERLPIELDVPSTLGRLTVSEGLDAEDAAERGTIYHKVMEMIDFANLSSADPKAIIESLKERGFIEEKGADRIEAAEIERFLSSDIAKRMERAAKVGKLRKEAPFTLRMEKDGREILVQGMIDCYFEEDGEYVLLDYKTNYVKQKSEEVYDHFRKIYAEQINLYAKAIEELRGGRVKERYLVMLSAGEALNI